MIRDYTIVCFHEDEDGPLPEDLIESALTAEDLRPINELLDSFSQIVESYFE